MPPPPSRPQDDPQARVTMTHVAERVGVSVATVSYVMNGRPGVGDAVRTKVLEAADELGFRPNRLAQGLRRGRTKLLGLLLADIANPFYPELAAGVIDRANELGYQVFLSQTGGHGEFTEREARALLDLRCDALIFTSVTSADRPLLTQLLAEGISFVQTVRRVEDLPADFVGIDDRAGGRDLIAHLLELGHTDLAFLHGPTASSASAERLAGSLAALADAGHPPADDRVLEAGLTLAGGYQGARELLDRGDGLPSAIVCGNDVIALGAIDALMDAGVRVPEDVAIVGYDDMSFASTRRVDLTTVHQPLRQMGAAAVQLLVERLEDPDRAPRNHVLPHHLVARSSSGTPADRREPHHPRVEVAAAPVGSAR